MKNSIFIFVIGTLFGAVISTGAFFVYTTTINSCDSNSNNTQMNNGQPPEMPSGQSSGFGEPPERPSGEGEEPPSRSGENNNQSSNT